MQKKEGHKFNTNEKGITLITLVITIIVLMILSTATINVVFGDNGLIEQAKLKKGSAANSIEYEAEVTANLEMHLSEIYTGTEIALPSIPQEPTIPQGTINFENPQWVGDGTATVVITTDNTQDELQYQINSTENEWAAIESGETITGLKHNDTVYGRLWNGTMGTEPGSTSIKDNTPPEVTISTSSITTNSATLTVTAKDEQSGLTDTGTYSYYLNDALKVSNTANSYTYTGLNAGTSYTVKVIVRDNAGQTTEKSTTITTVSLPTVSTTLKAGNYVYYLDKTGTRRLCRVLYDNSSGYGVQIITADTVEDYTLGVNNNVNTSINQYTSAITLLNSEAAKYLNTTYATSARCVGSVPNNPSYDGAGMYSNYNYSYMNGYNGRYKDSDNNYLTDWNQMRALNIYNIGKYYWLASRSVTYSSSLSSFDVRHVTNTGTVWSSWLFYIGTSGLGSNSRCNWTKTCVHTKR